MGWAYNSAVRSRSRIDRGRSGGVRDVDESSCKDVVSYIRSFDSSSEFTYRYFSIPISSPSISPMTSLSQQPIASSHDIHPTVSISPLEKDGELHPVEQWALG